MSKSTTENIRLKLLTEAEKEPSPSINLYWVSYYKVLATIKLYLAFIPADWLFYLVAIIIIIYCNSNEVILTNLGHSWK